MKTLLNKTLQKFFSKLIPYINFSNEYLKLQMIDKRNDKKKKKLKIMNKDVI